LRTNESIEPGARRREFLRMLCGGAAAAIATKPAASPAAEAAGLPRGKIGDLELSRLMLGTNHITFYMHSRDLRYVDQLSRHYNTDEKIIETFAAAEANGINTFMTHGDPKIESLFKRYRSQRGGKMKWIVAPWFDGPAKAMDVAAYTRLVPQLVDAGVDALYVPGMITDRFVKEGKGELIGELLSTIKACSVPGGVACHALDVVRFCEEAKLPVDFYVKTFHHLKYPTAPPPETIKTDHAEVPGFWCRDAEAVSAFMAGVAKPWIAFKVMAAGAIPPKEAFQYAFSNGADFILAGMFDFQVAEDARIAAEVLAGLKSRPRPWCG